MTESNWRQQIASAGTSDEVVAVARRFLSTWTAHQLGALPSRVRPEAVESAEDVNAYALRLMQAQLKEDSTTAELQAMTAFFTEAAARLTQIFTNTRRDLHRMFLTK